MKSLNTKTLSLAFEVTGGGKVCLKDFTGQNIVLYFYPKDDTPGCTQEGQEFSSLYKKFQALNTPVFGVSRDTLPSHEKFKKKYQYPFNLISDTEEKLCKAFNVLKEKNMYGKKVLGVERSTFILNTRGEVVQEWRKVKVPGHALEVLQFVKSLS